MLVDSSVLVLNQNYEPLSVCTARRALVMQFMGKVEIVETYDGLKVHSVYRSFPLPSVVRVGSYIKVRYRKVQLTRKNIIKRDRHTCQYCGDRTGPMTVDHIIPRSFGGSETWENLTCACSKCNNRKGDLLAEKVGMRLKRRARRPSHIQFIQSFIGIGDERWKQYLFLD